MERERRTGRTRTLVLAVGALALTLHPVRA